MVACLWPFASPPTPVRCHRLAFHSAHQWWIEARVANWASKENQTNIRRAFPKLCFMLAYHDLAILRVARSWRAASWHWYVFHVSIPWSRHTQGGKVLACCLMALIVFHVSVPWSCQLEDGKVALPPGIHCVSEGGVVLARCLLALIVFHVSLPWSGNSDGGKVLAHCLPALIVFHVSVPWPCHPEDGLVLPRWLTANIQNPKFQIFRIARFPYFLNPIVQYFQITKFLDSQISNV